MQKLEEVYHVTRTQLYDVQENEAVSTRVSDARIIGPQCQHVDIGRCKRCADPMNPDNNKSNPAWFGVNLPHGEKLFANVNSRSVLANQKRSKGIETKKQLKETLKLIRS
jgi:hypothetical protein